MFIRVLIAFLSLIVPFAAYLSSGRLFLAVGLTLIWSCGFVVFFFWLAGPGALMIAGSSLLAFVLALRARAGSKDSAGRPAVETLGSARIRPR